ncbi:MAG: hypothetical protein HBSAPP02_26330 [Phycisphaerae bacterium]|nr:MAG: PEP-CTERM sorting domain-containing protein [Planctomycetia bacterium]RIK68189.1 MAG: hypothetical protein DCC66_10790 [Planctomycetota bacterium]GJQ27601.1 MAG: hypothetical protein HBSAPP02_26330 [Phycisphaerae bacterium]
MLKRVSILAVVAMLATATVANAFPPLAEWGFQVVTPADVANSATNGPHAADSGIFAATSGASGAHASAATDWTTPTGNGSSDSYSANEWAPGDYWQFCTSTVGYSGITVQWDQVSSNTGPRDFELRYNVNGGTYSTFGSPYVVRANSSPSWSSGSGTGLDTFSVDLSSVTALDNQSEICIRHVNTTTVSATGGTVGNTGTNRVDNVVISGVPEPTTLALMGLGAIGLIRRRR